MEKGQERRREPITIGIMGTGAVGGYFGAMLARAGHRVVFVARPETAQVIVSTGLRLERSDTLEVLMPPRISASSSPQDLRQVDAVLLCVKATATEEAAALMRGVLRPETWVMSLQNGVDNAARAQAVLERPVIPAAVYVACAMPEPGLVRHFGRGDLVIGPPPPMRGQSVAAEAHRQHDAAARRGQDVTTELLDQIAACFSQAAIPVVVSPQVAEALWSKLLVNCAYNAISALAQVDYGTLAAQAGIRSTMDAIVQEVLDLSHASGLVLDRNAALGQCAAIAAAMPRQLSSTAQDLARGRTSEIDHLNGFVVREALRLGVATPVNQTLYALVKLLEFRGKPQETPQLPRDFHDWLRELGLATETSPAASALTGGVSSEIWSVELSSGKHVVKRALPRLKVSQSWEVPIERSRHEAAWMHFAAQADPASVPQCVASDDRRGMLLMRYLPPSRFRLWKSMLRDGEAIPAQAHAVGTRLARIHAASANPAVAVELRARFDHTPLFHAIRLEPYLEATAQRHPALSDALHALSRTTAHTRHALVHGDISPKNILIGPDGPVFLDAECAWWGDPAFDLAFCLKHLLLKRLWVPAHQALHRASFGALVDGYREGIAANGSWEPWEALEARAAALLPALTLARVDGKSPVEYLTRAECRQRVRDLTREAILAPHRKLEDVHRHWIFHPGVDPCT